MSNDEAYLQIPKGRGPRKRRSETILNPGRSKSPRQAKTDENERANNSRKADKEVDRTPLARNLQPAAPNNEHLVSEELEQDSTYGKSEGLEI
ncbi:hypothetical protein CEP51_014805 [Fusarium floridanum]|uniref:Uncharacterized protein n=1 Tax=Fusarium floridanum TaxID=1325733 RepID=A0A428PLM3_9HYPO|nr:hypothetical protein CEP51_014805 [Fusarium floridanum]